MNEPTRAKRAETPLATMLREYQIQYTELALRSDVAMATISRIARGGDCTTRILGKLAVALSAIIGRRIEARDLVPSAGVSGDVGEEPDTGPVVDDSQRDGST